MQCVITAIGPDHRGLADPIVHSVTNLGANIGEIQMYDHDQEALFSMLTRVELPNERYDELRSSMQEVASRTGLSIRTWSPEIQHRLPRLAICVTYRPETPSALLDAIEQGVVHAEPAVMISNRESCRYLAEEHQIPWESIGDSNGRPDDHRLVELCDSYQVDYIVLARYMRVLPPSTCWMYAGGRIVNLHHGLLPGFPGMRPYDDAFSCRMLTYGATCHFIVPELDAGNQIICQSAFTVVPGTSRDEIVRRGEQENEPACLVEGIRRVVDGEVQLHFNRVVSTGGQSVSTTLS